MAAEQLKLFSVCNVLHERFGRAFFRTLPATAGVYLMYDARDALLYVGKAKNLRQRIGSYRYAQPECSKKTARLLGCVTDIRWQTCTSEEGALLEENRLLRELRPRFNRVNTWPKASRFVRITLQEQSVHLSLASDQEGECYGAFKGASRECFAALLRLLSTNDRSYALLPRSLLSERGPSAYEFSNERAQAWLPALRSFFHGIPDALSQHFASAPEESCPFYRAFRESDVAAVSQFFRAGPERNRALRKYLRAGDLIPPEALDDFIVRQRFLQSPSAANANATPSADGWSHAARSSIAQ